MIGATPEPPYLAVIFSSQRADQDPAYADMAQRMVELAQGQPGFLGMETARNAEGFGITVSYWKDEAAIAAWKSHAEHVVARRKGREAWYSAFQVRVCRVEREYGLGQP